MADNSNEKEKEGSVIKILIATIGLFATLGGAAMSNWDKIFSKPSPTVSQSGNSSTASPTMLPSPAKRSIAGTWEQYDFVENGNKKIIGKFRVTEQNNIYSIASLYQVNSPNTENSIAISDITYNGVLVTFTSTWSNGATTYFRLERISETMFEGEYTVNGERRGRTRMEKIE